MLRLLLLATVVCCAVAQSGEDCKIDFAIAVDGSGSIEVDNPVKGNWAILTGFLRSVVLGFDVGTDATRIAIVKFDERSTIHFQLDTFDTKSETLIAAEALDYNRGGGRTNLDEALTDIKDIIFQPENGDRPDVRNVLLIITDGKPTDILNANLENTVAQLKADGVRIIGLGITPSVEEDFMRNVIVSQMDTDYFGVDDFENLPEILDQITEQSCTIVTGCNNPSDLYLVLDGSGSIDTENFLLLKTFAANMVSGLTVESGATRVGLVLFGDDAQILFDLTTFDTRDDIIAAINAIEYPRGRTNTENAFDMVRNQGFTSGRGDRSDIQNVMVLLTDGNSNTPQATYASARAAKAAGIHVITVGIGNWINGMELTLLASYPYSRNYIQVASFQNLNDELRLALTDLTCNNVNECLANPCQSGGTCVDMIGMYLCLCPSGRSGQNCERQCRMASDVTFAIDSSGSVGRNNFLMELDYVRELVMGLNLEEDSRVAAIRYANNAEMQFPLNEFSSKMDVLNALSMLYIDGTTNTATAIQMMRSNSFTSGNGDRSNVQNVGVVITDGRSNDFMATWSQAETARGDNIEMVAVGVGNNLNMLELETIASAPTDSNVLQVNGFSTLSDSVSDALDLICNNEDACNPNPCQNNGQCTDLLSGYSCDCTTGFSGMTCDRSCDKTYDIVLAIDTSGSIRNERMPQVLEFIAQVVAEFEVSQSEGARFGAVSFSDDVTPQFNLNKYDMAQDVITAIKSVPFTGGSTNIASALEYIKNTMFTSGNGDRDGVQNYIILFTDGESNVREEDTMQMAIDARVEGAKILSVAIGNAVNLLEMRGMTSNPYQDMMMMAESFSAITTNEATSRQIRDNIVRSTCDDVNECDSNPCQNSQQCVDDLFNYYCDCNDGFSGETCSRSCTNSMDVALVLDFSGSLDQVSDIVIEFARQVVQGLPFTQSRARVAVVSYSDEATLHFDFNEYSTKREVLNALSFSRYGGRTNTAGALQEALNNVFTASGGNRNGVQNIAIVVTDGGSNINSGQTSTRADDMRRRGIDVHVAAVYNLPDPGEVNAIANSPSDDFVVNVVDSAAVVGAANTLLGRLCN